MIVVLKLFLINTYASLHLCNLPFGAYGSTETTFLASRLSSLLLSCFSFASRFSWLVVLCFTLSSRVFFLCLDFYVSYYCIFCGENVGVIVLLYFVSHIISMHFRILSSLTFSEKMLVRLPVNRIGENFNFEKRKPNNTHKLCER